MVKVTLKKIFECSYYEWECYIFQFYAGKKALPIFRYTIFYFDELYTSGAFSTLKECIGELRENLADMAEEKTDYYDRCFAYFCMDKLKLIFGDKDD